MTTESQNLGLTSQQHSHVPILLLGQTVWWSLALIIYSNNSSSKVFYPLIKPVIQSLTFCICVIHQYRTSFFFRYCVIWPGIQDVPNRLTSLCQLHNKSSMAICIPIHGISYTVIVLLLNIWIFNGRRLCEYFLWSSSHFPQEILIFFLALYKKLHVFQTLASVSLWYFSQYRMSLEKGFWLPGNESLNQSGAQM